MHILYIQDKWSVESIVKILYQYAIPAYIMVPYFRKSSLQGLFLGFGQNGGKWHSPRPHTPKNISNIFIWVTWVIGLKSKLAEIRCLAEKNIPVSCFLGRYFLYLKKIQKNSFLNNFRVFLKTIFTISSKPFELEIWIFYIT